MHDTYAVVVVPLATCSAAFSGTLLTLHLAGCGHALWLRAAAPALLLPGCCCCGHVHGVLPWQAHLACMRARHAGMAAWILGSACCSRSQPVPVSTASYLCFTRKQPLLLPFSAGPRRQLHVL